MQAKHALFDAAQTELSTGINLIEASAGTGKTYAIAMLVLRFVVEQDVRIENILVVTFTTAATEELRERVRSRLAEAKRVLETQDENSDTTLLNWLAQLDLEPEIIAQRLKTALLFIDQTSIFTIHSFCKKMLREHALESGQLFDAELTDDLASIKQACADDFWRKQIYSRSTWQAAVLMAQFTTPDALLDSVDRVADYMVVYPDVEDLDAALYQLEDIAASAKIELDKFIGALEQSRDDDKFNASYRASIAEMYPSLANWLQGGLDIPDTKSLLLLTEDGLKKGLNGNKFKSAKNQSREDYLASLAINTAPFEKLSSAIANISLILRRLLLESLRTELAQRMQQLNVLSFDLLISRLSDALNSDKGETLSAQLRERFACALIDEFQDTDNYQWTIFSKIFASREHFLYLIGDPKQAIYKFRGADIYSYLAAQHKAQHQFTLGKNWRSHPHLVQAVNCLFAKDNPFLLEDLTFTPVEPAKSKQDGELFYQGQSTAPMQLWQLYNSESGHWSKKSAETEIRLAVCHEIVSLLGNDYQLSNNKTVQPRDIAILVRTNQQARDYQEALREVSIPAVLNNIESIFHSPEARELLWLLQAVANPSNSRLLKQALTLSWFGFDGLSLYALLQNENALDKWMTRFSDYYQDWQKLGLMAMMHRLLKQESIPLQLAKTKRAERQLTNIAHLVELVHQAAINDHLGINKTLDWLQSALYQSKTAESQQLRLESDEDAVQLVTMHRSKGLEYPIVFCPCLWQDDDHLAKEQSLITCHKDGRMIADLGSQHFEEHRKQAKFEQDAENLRVLYVAVTRAKYRCYLVWADVRGKEKANQSALANLLDFADKDFQQQQAVLQNLVAQQDCFAYQVIEPQQALDDYYKKQRKPLLLPVPQRQRVSLYSHWQMSSYTALSALSEHDAPELPEDKAREQGELLIPRASPEELPKGTHTGNVVHDLLENHAFNDLAQGIDISVARDKACSRYSLKLDRPELINELLVNVVKTPLSDSDTQFCLMNIAESQCLKEMPFYLALAEINVQKINTVLQNTPAYQTLSSKTISGYLTGFIDLICQYNGQYYVIDYKTNYLADYKDSDLTLAMREHNYGLQYWLYCVVLHRYLQNRLPDYDYKQHFGGVRYLFVRGMSPELAMSGVYQDRPDLIRLNKLLALFGV
jgi:exodeoxyribonuclease V beta subunit